ncbi:MAG: energy transducer TonB [Janthinobacterium lividum]
MAEQDQYDRLHNVPDEGSHDAAHQQQVHQLLASQKLRTGRDYYNAALILQHADSASDYLKANELAKKSLALNPHDRATKTLIAQSWDRYQRSLGQPQWYGTQRYTRDGREYLQLTDTTRVTEDERRTYFVSTLAEKLAYFNKQANRHETSLRAYMLSNEQQRSLAQRPTGTELIGSNEELFGQVRYPSQASQRGIAGKVLLQATVAPNGTISHASVVRGLGYGCDEEALRVMKTARFSNPTGEEQEIRMAIPFGPTSQPGAAR